MSERAPTPGLCVQGWEPTQGHWDDPAGRTITLQWCDPSAASMPPSRPLKPAIIRTNRAHTVGNDRFDGDQRCPTLRTRLKSPK
jgi:hypothetical protein